MIYELPDLRNAKLSGKTVLLRADLDVSLLDNGQIESDVRLKAWLPTLKYLLNKRANVIISGHLGRPHKKCTMEDTECHLGVELTAFGLEPVAKWITKQFRVQSSEFRIKKENVKGFDGWKLADNLTLLENLRFNKEETEDPDTLPYKEFSKKLANLADIYINDCFATSHRDNASIVGVARFLPHFAGLRLLEEIKVLSEISSSPKRPLTVIVGGAKIETKLPLIEKMHGFADYILVGGKIVEEKETLIKLQNEKVPGKRAALLIADFAKDKEDITEYSLDNFLQIVEKSETVVWNGPVNKISNLIRSTSSGQISNSSERLAEGILKSGAYSVVGGGDTIGFLDKMGLLSKFSFYSTGGGAMLAFLAGEKLPGLEALC